MSFHHSLNHDTKTLSRETSQARGVTLRARSQTSIQAVAPTPQGNCSALIAMSTKCHTFGTTPKHVASCGYVEMRDKLASMFSSEVNQQVVEKCHFYVHLLKATCCQVVAKTVKGMWTARSENICCHGVADDFVSRINVWCCVSPVLRQRAATLQFS